MTSITAVSPSTLSYSQSQPVQHAVRAPDVDKTQDAFYRVRIQKLDDKGAVRFFNNIDPATGKVKGTKSEFSSIVDRATGDLYYDEEVSVVWGKCVALTVGIPLYGMGMIAWHLVRTPLVVKWSLCNALVRWPFSTEDIRNKLWEDITRIPSEIMAGIWGVVKAPFYAIAMEASAFVGLVHPYLGRKWVAAVEHAWHDKISIKQSFVTLPERPNDNCLMSCIKDTALNKPFYLAGCFQVKGNLSDKNIRVI